MDSTGDRYYRHNFCEAWCSIYVRYLCLLIVLGAFLTSLSLGADETHAPEDLTARQTDAEIRQRIIGTWTAGGYYYSTYEPVSVYRTLTFATNGYYSAVETVNCFGGAFVQKCEGTWSLQNRALTYSIMNSFNLETDPDSIRFFCTQARVIHVSKDQLFLIMVRWAVFQRDSEIRWEK